MTGLAEELSCSPVFALVWLPHRHASTDGLIFSLTRHRALGVVLLTDGHKEVVQHFGRQPTGECALQGSGEVKYIV